ncbi:hypothetical protein [Legionella feeleii]|uniref:Uncharacterized protein n=1 Tax=Legionella feeleii TaxID=453 RepID=A0A0W0TUD2_9GAMM|nr:hypothetical protein [Legionella feeleii]KTC99313.1 hypothetical protein Lfee_1376 [Legionella feeleii]SPX59214.1 Uncharacterised protein [Legionella feeleii]
MSYKRSRKLSHIFYSIILLSPLSAYSEICHIDQEVNYDLQNQVNTLGVDVNKLEILFDNEGLPSNSTIYVEGDKVDCQLIPKNKDQPSLRGNFPKMKLKIVVYFEDKSPVYNFYLSSPSKVKCKMDSMGVIVNSGV